VSNIYDRSAAVAYAHKWAMKRNPAYYNFSGIGGDCANFASQCLHAGGAAMNYTPIYGWYYTSVNDRAPAWSAVKYLHRFLTTNEQTGPYGREVPLEEIMPGDILQIATWMPDFHHTLVVVETGEQPDRANTLVACHSYDSDNRPLSSYDITMLRCIHIEGVR
jgi:hypothetical protein